MSEQIDKAYDDGMLGWAAPADRFLIAFFDVLLQQQQKTDAKQTRGVDCLFMVTFDEIK